MNEMPIYTPELEITSIKIVHDEVGTISVYIADEVAIVATSEDQVQAYLGGLAMGYQKGSQAAIVQWAQQIGGIIADRTLDVVTDAFTDALKDASPPRPPISSSGGGAG